MNLEKDHLAAVPGRPFLISDHPFLYILYVMLSSQNVQIIRDKTIFIHFPFKAFEDTLIQTYIYLIYTQMGWSNYLIEHLKILFIGLFLNRVSSLFYEE